MQESPPRLTPRLYQSHWLRDIFASCAATRRKTLLLPCHMKAHASAAVTHQHQHTCRRGKALLFMPCARQFIITSIATLAPSAIHASPLAYGRASPMYRDTASDAHIAQAASPPCKVDARRFPQLRRRRRRTRSSAARRRTTGAGSYFDSYDEEKVFRRYSQSFPRRIYSTPPPARRASCRPPGGWAAGRRKSLTSTSYCLICLKISIRAR